MFQQSEPSCKAQPRPKCNNTCPIYGSYGIATHLCDVAIEGLYFIFSTAQIKGFALDVRQVFRKGGGSGGMIRNKYQQVCHMGHNVP